MQKLVLRKLAAIVLMVSIIFTMGGFATLAESISDVVESSKDESEDKSDLSHKYYDDLVEASTDNVGASTASLSSADDEDIENDEEQDSTTYEEEPEEDENAETEGANETVETSTDNVETSNASPDEEAVEASEIVGASTASPSFAEEDTEDDVIDDTDINISTPSEETETNLNIASESSINIEDISNEVISTTSDLILATSSEVYFDDLLFGNVASESEISLASLSEISSEGYTQLLGAANLNLKSTIMFGNYKQVTAGTTDPITWKVLTVDTENNRALLWADKVLDGVFRYGPSFRWVSSDLRTFCNNTFYNEAFNADEKKAICATTLMDDGISNPDNYVFVLNKQELLAYNYTYIKQHDIPTMSGKSFMEWMWDCFKKGLKELDQMIYADDTTSLVCYPSVWAKTYTSDPISQYKTDKAEYWTRSRRDVLWEAFVDAVDFDGRLTATPPDRTRDKWKYGIGFRPAIWVDLNSSYFSGNTSKIKFDLGGSSFLADSNWNNFTSYREGVTTKLPSTEDIKAHSSTLELAGWIYGSNQTEPSFNITPTTKGDITAKAVWRGKHYKINWDLTDATYGNDGSWNGEAGKDNYQYGVGYTLPTNVTGPTERIFDHWEIDGVKVDNIPTDATGDKTIKAVYRNTIYKINWDLVDDETGIEGYLDGEYPTTYEHTVGVKILPSSVTIFSDRTFDHWEINGIATNSIAENVRGDVTLKATYKSTIWFGLYPQSDESGTQLEPIKWKVLSQNGNEALVVSEKILNGKKWIDVWNNDSWDTSSIRTWLSHDFASSAFSDNQLNRGIINKTITTDGKETNGKIFLLSIEEAKQYFVTNNSLIAKPTKYAEALSKSMRVDNNIAFWYLRSQSLDHSRADYVNQIGFIDGVTIFDSSTNGEIGIRPAFYLDLTSDIYKSSNNSVNFRLNGGSWNNKSELWKNFDKYQGGQKLPTAANIIPPEGETFLGWVYSGEDEFVTEIAPDKTGDIVLDAVYGSIWFGTYPQGDKTGTQKEPIKWKILKGEGNEALLISDKVIDNVSYHNTLTSVTWGNSDIRNWLANDFKNEAFTEGQFNNGIVTKNISTLNQDDTDDKLFILSYDEANSLYSNDTDRKSKATEYAKNINNNGGRLSVNSDNYSEYWLRTKGTGVTNSAQYVFTSGGINRGGAHVNNRTVGVRPAFYANLNSDIFRISNNMITWDLNGGSWKDGSKLWGEMTSYQGGQKLPTAENLIAPLNQEFLGWSYLGETATISEIEFNKTGDIILVAQWTNHPYSITWDLMDLQSKVEGSWVGETGPSTYTYGVGLPSLPTNATSNDAHRVFDHFEVLDSASSSCITKKDTGDKIIVAIYRNRKYNIIWDLEDRNTGDSGYFDGDYPTTYEYNVGLATLPTNVIGPIGREFDHWEINGKKVTNIEESKDDTVTLKAVYKNKIYSISWALGEGKWKNNYKPIVSYEYSVGASLPNANDHINLPNGKSFSRWIMRFEGDPTMYTGGSIGVSAHGDVEVMAEYANVSYNLTYQDEYGNPITWEGGVAGPATYTYQTGIPYLPRNVVAVGENEFDHWEINNLIVTGIAPTAYGDKVVTAMYKKKRYKITWHLDDIFGYTGDWDGEVGQDTYTYGTEYILPTNIKPPKASSFSHWETMTGVATTSIPKFATGNKEFRAVYIGTEYKITWKLNGAVINSAYCPDSYTYQQLEISGPIALPNESEITSVPSGKQFSHFAINGARATEIPKGTMGDLTITLVYKGEDVHKITWDYGVGKDHWEFDGWTPPATFSEGVPVSIPDVEYLYKTPNGREIDYFTVNGVEALEIDTNTDVVVAAVLKDITYRIKYNLGDGSWGEEEVGEETYTHGNTYLLSTDIIPPRGKKFNHWEINGVATTSIMPTDYGHKEFTAIYDTATYQIYWYLGSSTVSYDLPEEYTYGAEVQLPTETQITTSDGREFDYWTVNGVRTTKIDSSFAEFVVVSVNYVSYSINWEFGGGRVPYYYLASTYEKGAGLKLPAASDIIPPNNYTFDYLTVNGNKATEIPTTQVGNVVVKAVYKNSPSPGPSPKPTPYYPGGGDSGSGGGGGGGGGGIPMPAAVINTTYLNLLKSISQTYSENFVEWKYDPVSNKFKINISVGDEIISVVDGFCNINKITTQNNNGVVTQIPITDTYCFKDGNMLTGWIRTIDGKWYFMENAKNANEGKMVFGWKQIDGKWYYFTTDGSMLVNALAPDGRMVGADGAVIVV